MKLFTLYEISIGHIIVIKLAGNPIMKQHSVDNRKTNVGCA